MPGGLRKNWRVCEETVRRCFQDAVLISADTWPQRTSLSVASGRTAAWFRDAVNIFVGLWLSENDTASVGSYCLSVCLSVLNT